MDPLANFRAMLEQHEQTQNENARLRQQVEHLQAENKFLRGAIEFAQRLNGKNRKRSDELQDAFANALGNEDDGSRTENTRVPFVDGDDSSSTDTTEDSEWERERSSDSASHGHDSIAADSEDDRLSDAIVYSPDELPHEIGLVRSSDTRSFIYCEDTILPACVQACIVDYVRDAKRNDAAGQCDTLKDYFVSRTSCVRTSITGETSRWVDGVVGKFACKGCHDIGKACIMFDPMAKKLAVLPLPFSTLSHHARPGSDAWYISTNVLGMQPYLPVEPAVRGATRKRKRVA